MAHEKVLVVDNDEDYLNLMVSNLERHEYMVKGTTDGLEALSWVLEGTDFDILVSDLFLENIRGDELIRKARISDQHLQAIMITASDSIEDAIRAMREYGAFDYLIKPLGHMSQLSTVVGRAANKRRSQIQNQTHVQQLLLESSKLETMISSSKDGILVFDGHDKLSMFNSAAEEALNSSLSIGLSTSEALTFSLQTVLNNWQDKFDKQFSIVEYSLMPNYSLKLRISPMMEEPISDSGYLLVLTVEPLQGPTENSLQAANANRQMPEGFHQSPLNNEYQEFEAKLQRAADRLRFFADLKLVDKQTALPPNPVQVHETLEQLAYHWTSQDVTLDINVGQDAKISMQDWSLEQVIAEILLLLRYSQVTSTNLVLHIGTSHEFLWLTVTEANGDLVKSNLFTYNAYSLIRSILLALQGQIWWSPRSNVFPSFAIPLVVT